MGELRKRIGASMDMQKPQEGRETLKYLGGGRITTGENSYLKYEYVAPNSDIVAVDRTDLEKFLKGHAMLYSGGGTGINIDFEGNNIVYKEEGLQPKTVTYSPLPGGQNVGIDLKELYGIMTSMSTAGSYGGVLIPVEHWTDEEESARQLLARRQQRQGPASRESSSIGKITQE